ncbi:lytic polysaccharide monooxygenase auxiliary activity family 9 protein [Streptomyces spiramenti]|uniref:Lytic polysaccharide monooxygenase n=1 Tax=Streptomyces spiramenti TaxID=2720606 RepID=A0ABX1ALY9_9ACTN|nr:lytic polysaccharide monooxygenase auxiliary activity family 9 protein [Streptomyces spiramenti]NJP65643.1 lytic polysaccharide monooxygenase [Streptomyces spiramenti]
MRTKLTAAVTGLGLAAATVLAAAGAANSHGYTTSPTSRQAHCAQGAAPDCGNIVWEPQSVEGPKGFPQAGPADGTICSGGNGQFSQLDQARNGSWPTTSLTSGAGFTFDWTITAAHSTTDFRYFVTKDGWNPDTPLTRADLEPQPFLTVPMDGRQPNWSESHTGTLPQKSGRHLILAVWDVADTANAFYACSDVQF